MSGAALALAALALQGLPAGARLDTVATGLEVPWALAFTPDGRVFVSERPGRIRVVEHGRLRPTPWATLPVVPPSDSGAGLQGITVAPDFSVSRAVLVAGTFRTRDGGLENRLYRLTDSAGAGVAPRILLDGIPAARAHTGGAVAFGPDGMLYLTTGDAFRPERSGDPSSLGGKVLRLRSDGRVPADNPAAGSPVYARGLRNVQGLAWDRETGTLFALDHGPSDWPWEGGRKDHDELNVVRPGGHYGWPHAIGLAGDGRYVDPIADWTPAIAPSGLASSGGSLLVGALKGRELRRVTVRRHADGSWRVIGQESLIPSGDLGRIRAVASAPDGSVWFTTSNRRGADSLPDDRIYRLTLPERTSR